MPLQPHSHKNLYNLVVMDTSGEWLRSKRKALRMRQEDVAIRAHVSPSYISTIERGQKHSTSDGDLKPDRDKLIRIAKAVNGNPDELLAFYEYRGVSAVGTESLDVPGVGTLSFDKKTAKHDLERMKIVYRTALETARAMIEAEANNSNN